MQSLNLSEEQRSYCKQQPRQKYLVKEIILAIGRQWFSVFYVHTADINEIIS